MRLVVLSALCLVAATGCDALFGLTRIQDHGDATMSDAPRDGTDIRPDGRVDAAVDAQVDAPRTPGCPTNYGTIGTLTGKYRIGAALVDWPTAEQLCENDRGNFALYTHLIVFAEDNERSQVNALVSGQIRWIGLSDRKTNLDYKWVSTENPLYPTLSAWQNSSPDTTPGADCGEMLGNSDLQVTGCAPMSGLNFICECDAFAVDKSHF